MFPRSCVILLACVDACTLEVITPSSPYVLPLEGEDLHQTPQLEILGINQTFSIDMPTLLLSLPPWGACLQSYVECQESPAPFCRAVCTEMPRQWVQPHLWPSLLKGQPQGWAPFPNLAESSCLLRSSLAAEACVSSLGAGV